MQSSRSIQTKVQRRRICAIQATRRRSSHEISSLDGTSRYGFFGIRTPVAAFGERTPQQQQQARYYCNWSRWNHLDHSTRFQPLVSTTWNVHRTGGGGGGQRRAVRVVGSSTTSPACPLRNFSRTAGFHHATPPQLSSAAERLLATLEDDDDDEDDDNEEELEFLANQYMSQQQLVPHHHHQQQHLQSTPSSEGFLHDSSSLDLELGEESVWDDVGSEIAEDDFEIIEDEFINDEIARARASTLDEPEPRREINALDMLAHFDPEDPPKTNDLHEMQVWLECEAQKENLLKYQKALDAARKRKDYKSLSLVQKQIVQWFPHLQQEFTQMQRDFLYKPKDSKKKQQQQQQQQQKDVDEEVDSDDVPSTTTSTKFAGQNKKSYKSYGPYLCSLSPEKLAVITAHEAILKCLLSSENLSGAGGCGGVPFVAVAKRLGEAVEEEVLIHRMLYKRFKEKQAWKTQNKNARTDEEHDNGDELGEATSEQVATRSTASTEQQSDTDDKTQEATTTTDTPAKWVYAASHLKDYLDELNRHGNNTNKLGARSTRYAIRKARQVVEREEEWSDSEKVQLGAALFHVLLENATIGGGPHAEPAFSYEKRWTRKHRRQAFVTLNEKIYNMIVSDDLKSFAALTTRYKPMVVPPKPWKSNDDGGYLWLKADLMRHHGCKIQKEALENADMSTLFDGLNFLGGVAWKINKPILQIAQQCWEEGIKLGDLPSPNDFELPPEPGSPPRFLYKNKNDDDDNDSNNPMLDKDSPAYQQAMAEIQAYRDAKNKFRRIHQKNMDLRSLRCSAILKLDQAFKFQEFEQLYFPYNVDFRGRAYPVPPHLSNVGSDLCRGLLTFAKAKPLGPRGLFWLKVHLANFAGNDKISFEERAQFIDDNMDKVRASAEYPLGRRDGADGDDDDDDDEPWWMQQEDPFQALATCMEIVRAIDSGDPESYMCSLPVHMDGSCNGLQHYAALGRDRVGGKAVNLCATNVPQDVYSGVMHEVIRRVAEEAERKLDFIDDSSDSTLMATDSLSRSQKKALTSHRAAQLVNGLIDRGVVKRTVMTSVYGVTYVGARQQIKEKIESKLEEQGKDIDMMEREIFHACGYLARVTMDVMGDLFTGAKETMNWLTTCARMITQHGYPVAWMSPIGIPAIQPYRQKKTFTLVTLMQTVTLVLEHDDLPLHKGRQVTAFPPNYVHSLDSSHMLLTALEMDRRGLTFSAVHDSFWTHACDVDEMNVALREEFVKLYDQPLLERLKQDWEMRYPDLDFPDLPEHGDLDLNEVKEAPYFFQ